MKTKNSRVSRNKKLFIFYCIAIFVAGLIFLSKIELFGFHNPASFQTGVQVTMYSNMKQEAFNERIFFHETSGGGSLSLRQLCAVESAALHNPDRPVQVFFHVTKELDKNGQWFSVISKYPNIELILLNETQYFANSPFDTWYVIYNENRDSSANSARRMSQVARILNAFRHGGTYLDLDILVLRKINEKTAGNFFAFLTPIEDDNRAELGSNAFHLDFGSETLKKIVTYLSTQFDWISAYPDILQLGINEIMKKACSGTNEHKDLSFKMSRCGDVSLLPPNYFNFLSSEDVPYLFHVIENESVLEKIKKFSVAVHFWGSISHTLPLYDMKLPFILLALEHCPVTTRLSFIKNGIQH